MEYFISQIKIDWSDNRWKYKGGKGLKPKRRKGYVGLFDRNVGHFIWFKIIKICQDRYGYIVERNKKVSGYWSELNKI